MIKTALSDKEIVLLQDYLRSPIELIRAKAVAMLARHRGVSLDDLVFICHRSTRTLMRWISDFDKRRMSSIYSGMEDNQHAAKLTKEQKEEIKAVLGQPPDERGIPKEFWDVPKLKNYVQVRFGVVYESDVSYHFLFRYSGLSLKYPDKLSPRRNDQLIKKRMRAIKKEIKPMRKDPAWVILTADETRLQLESEIRRAWLVKGKRTVVRTERSDEHQNYLGFLDQKTGKFSLYEIERGNQEETIRVLKLLMTDFPNQRVCVIWDNAKWHKGKILQAELGKGIFQGLHLINLPPYAPDHNPTEHVWQYAKSQLANRHETPFNQTKHQFAELITNRHFRYKI